jgi:hypothetical protein
MDIGSYILGETAGLIAGILIFALVLAVKNWGKEDVNPVVFTVRYIDVLNCYLISTVDSRVGDYKVDDIPPRDLFATMEKTSKKFSDIGYTVSFKVFKGIWEEY